MNPESLDIVRYIADMTAQLEGMAIAGHFDMLAYFLGMAKAESELLVRMSPAEEQSLAEGPAQDETEQDEDQDQFHHNGSFD